MIVALRFMVQMERAQRALMLDANADWAKEAHTLIQTCQKALQKAEASSGHTQGSQQQQQSKKQQQTPSPEASTSAERNGNTAAAESDADETEAESATYGQYSYTYGADGQQSTGATEEPWMATDEDQQASMGALWQAYDALVGR